MWISETWKTIGLKSDFKTDQQGSLYENDSGTPKN